MSESITFNNGVYIIPDVGESNWGQNLTNYFVAIPSGCYQLSGGTNPLTAALSFGSSFGISALSLTSVTTHPASTGVIQLANIDAISWRNHANSADLPLSVDTSNNLLWNGDIISTSSSSPVLSITGTANEITASASTGNVTLSIPSTFIAPGTIAATTSVSTPVLDVTNSTNQIVLGTTRTLTITSPEPASSSRTLTLPDPAGNDSVAYLALAQTFTNKTLTTPVINGTITGTTVFPIANGGTNSSTALNGSMAIVSNSTGIVEAAATTSTEIGYVNGVTSAIQTQINTKAPTASPTFTTSATAPVFDATATTNQLALGTTKITTISATAPASSLTYTIPDAGASANMVLDKGNYTIGGTWSFSNNITLSGNSKSLILTDDSTHTVSMKATNSTTTYTLSLPTTAGTNGYFLQTDGSGNTTWASGGSGTVGSGTSGQNAVYNGTTSITSGATMSMNSTKITSLANGTASTDAAAFGQVKVLQTVTFTSSTSKSTTSSTFQATNLTANITPTSSSNRILIMVSGQLEVDAGGVVVFATISRNGSDLSNGNGFMLSRVSATGISANQQSASAVYVDSPATTSSTTYAVYVKNTDNATSVTWGSSVTQSIVLMEVV